MKVRAFPEREKSHKRLKDLADLHALVWYGSDFNQFREDIQDYLTQEDITRFTSGTTNEVLASAAALIGVDTDVFRNSIQNYSPDTFRQIVQSEIACVGAAT